MSKTNYRTVFAGKSFRKKALIGSLILSILTGSFIVQTKFIASENKHLVESLAKSTLPAEQNAETKPEIAKSNPLNLAVSEINPASDLPQNEAPEKSAQAVKVVLKESKKWSENAAQNLSGSRDKRESGVERLRRAEKILTGF